MDVIEESARIGGANTTRYASLETLASFNIRHPCTLGYYNRAQPRRRVMVRFCGFTDGIYREAGKRASTRDGE